MPRCLPSENGMTGGTLSVGRHSITATGRDFLGNPGAASTTSWDRKCVNSLAYPSPPEAATQCITKNSVKFRPQAEINPTQYPAFTYEYMFSNMTEFVPGVDPTFRKDDFPEGITTVTIAVTDAATGCTDPDPLVLSICVDTIKPVIPFGSITSTSLGADNVITATTLPVTPTFTWGIPDDNMGSNPVYHVMATDASGDLIIP